jgi:two-component system, NtrC family, sensor kinase
LTHSLSAKLILLQLGSMVVIFSLLGYLTIRLHRQHLEAATLASADRVSDVIRRSTTYYMLRNDREGLYRTIQTMAGEPGMAQVRVFDQDGRVRYSTDAREVNQYFDNLADLCRDCKLLSPNQLDGSDRFHIYRNQSGKRVLRVLTPIENQPSCSTAACHAHPAHEQVLGMLDTNLSLAKADAQLAESSIRTTLYTLAAMLVVAFLSWTFIWQVVHKPIRTLNQGTQRLASGELGYQIEARSRDEVGDLARSFNEMSVQLCAANQNSITWARTLEDRVQEKTRELKSAYDHLLHVEKMASVGKMAAVVAHEINNPLAGILTYAKLLRKWIDRNEMQGDKLKEAGECLDLIGSESRRCGDIVKNLLVFSRTAPLNVESTDINIVVDRCIRLVQHQLEMNGIELQLYADDELPILQCDPAQIEQVLLALIMNATDAMPHGGNLWLRTGMSPARDAIEIEVRDEGTGIPPDVLQRLFEPFQTTKEQGRGVGLGLAISRSIIDRHNGKIEVKSELGKGTTFTVVLPLDSRAAVSEPNLLAVTNAR